MLYLLLILPLTLALHGPALYGHGQPLCATVYQTAVINQCHTQEEQVCVTEIDTVVDTTEVEQCEDVVTQLCQQVAAVGHSRAVVPYGLGLLRVKRGENENKFNRRQQKRINQRAKQIRKDNKNERDTRKENNKREKKALQRNQKNEKKAIHRNNKRVKDARKDLNRAVKKAVKGVINKKGEMPRISGRRG